ncbi:hypothetical protein C8J56DRAFT_19592 [Mycena floridula]|nr:hypothetical protein C8J56DRAFT_19592 [Mycena floridula]
MDFIDTAWCLYCNTQIAPKRYLEPCAPLEPPLSSLSSHSSTKSTKRSGGLVRGTGRVNPNGTIKAAPVKFRTVIDQGPSPSYCSEKCQLDDLGAGHFPANHNPYRHSMPQLPVRENNPRFVESPSMRNIAAAYNFPPLPAPVIQPAPEPAPQPLEYNSGTMVASKYIETMAETNRLPPKSDDSRYPEPIPAPKILPGWNDGSNLWRPIVYSLSSSSSPPSPSSSGSPNSFSGFKPSSHRSSHTSYSAPTPRTDMGQSETDALMSKYAASFTRQAQSVPALSTSPARPLLPRGTNLLVLPEMVKRVRSSSSTSLSSMASSQLSRPNVPSPLSLSGSDSSDDIEEPCDSPTDEEKQPELLKSRRSDSSSSPRRPVIESRTWSYDNIPTYSVMPLPEGRRGTSKKLFLFAGKPAS